MPDPLENEEGGGLNIPPIGGDGDSPPENPYLSGVDEADLPIIQKYAEDWSQKFVPSEEFEKYKGLGELEDLQNAMGVMQNAQADPVAFYQYIKGQLEEMGLLEVEDNNAPPPGDTPPTVLPEYEGLNPQFVEKFQGLEKTLEGINKFVEDYNQSQQEQTQQQQLDNLLQELENSHGKFDQAAVLGRMLNGMSPEDAIKDYQRAIQELTQSNTPPKTPPVTLGAGGIPRESQDMNKILSDKKSRVDLVAQLLDAAKDS